MRPTDYMTPSNARCWALGTRRRNGFFVRRIVWGLALAQEEVRDGEEIRAAHIRVEDEFHRRGKAIR